MSIRWEILDDHRFVQLVSELLKRLGFVDIHIQGDGPDGGLDIIATELVPMTFQGTRPFRWGIQCKFSKPGGRRAVNESEIRDVEGILRSNRYQKYGLQGYMVITNRRVSQNVAERLLGIDSSSPYRAAWIDGSKLAQYLSEHPDLLDSYFSDVIRQIEKLAQEQAEERRAELTGKGKFRIDMVPDQDEPSVFYETGDIGGTFRGPYGVLKLEHNQTIGRVYGRYTYNSEEFVAELEGEFDRGIIKYRFHWLTQEISGVGFYLISQDGNRLEGVWLIADDLDNLTFEYLWHHGHRSSYERD